MVKASWRVETKSKLRRLSAQFTCPGTKDTAGRSFVLSPSAAVAAAPTAPTARCISLVFVQGICEFRRAKFRQHQMQRVLQIQKDSSQKALKQKPKNAKKAASSRLDNKDAE